jgi:hypothetical protein
MKYNNILMKILFVSLAALFILACNAVASIGATVTPESTDMPASTNTPLPTNIPAATNTHQPPPTETEIPSTPTPAPVGEAVRSANFEVKVVAAEKRTRVNPGGKFMFVATSGNMLVDIGVKVSNLTGSNLSVKWKDIYIMSKNQDAWYSTWGTWKDSSGNLDPFTIGISEVYTNPELEISISHDGYLRLFYHIPRGETYYFGFFDSPLTVINFK